MTAKQQAKLKKDLIGWGFCLASIVLFAVFVLLPLVMAFYLSLTEYNLTRIEFVGFANFADMFTVETLRNQLFKSVGNVLYYTVLAVPLTILPPFVVSALLQNKLRGSKVFRVLLYLPALVGSVAMALIWSWFFNVAYSPINAMLRALGLGEFQFLESTKTAMITLVLMVAWSGLGGNVVMYSAAMQTIPGEYYEAAKMDGASSVRQFFRITVPMLMPTTFFLFTMGIIGSLQLFDPVYLLTNGGPEQSTITPAYLIYVTSFESARRAGYGSALAVVLFAVVMVVTFLFQKFTKEQVV